MYGQKETIGRGNKETYIRHYLYVDICARIIWPWANSVKNGILSKDVPLFNGIIQRSFRSPYYFNKKTAALLGCRYAFYLFLTTYLTVLAQVLSAAHLFHHRHRHLFYSDSGSDSAFGADTG